MLNKPYIQKLRYYKAWTLGIFILLTIIVFFVNNVRIKAKSPDPNNYSSNEENIIGVRLEIDHDISADSNWPQVQGNPQRTGYTPEILGSNFQVSWTHPFQPEKIFPQVQAIIYDGKVYVGTEMGNLYALNAQTGSVEWVYHVGAPILNSVAAGSNKVYFGAMDGAIYAISSTNGSLVWREQLSPWRKAGRAEAA